MWEKFKSDSQKTILSSDLGHCHPNIRRLSVHCALENSSMFDLGGQHIQHAGPLRFPARFLVFVFVVCVCLLFVMRGAAV